MKASNLDVVLDLQWGSTGKGKLVAWLAIEEGVDVSTCDFQTNAGHTAVFEKDEHKLRTLMVQQLPMAVVNPDCKLLINPGATITVKKLLEEIEEFGAADRLTIHPNATIITQDSIEWEKVNLPRISSTLKGCGAALGFKTMRAPFVQLARDVPELDRWIGDTTEILHDYLRRGARCLAEGAQGFDLSLNHGHQYPFVTSRDVTTASILSNAGVPPQMVGRVYGCVRAFPIRVGHQYDTEGNFVGSSGPHHDDQRELSWGQIEEYSGAKSVGVDLLERTTVTKKVRRVFSFSDKQLRRAMMVCRPSHLFVNFVEHVNETDRSKTLWVDLSASTRRYVINIERVAQLENPDVVVSHLGTGAAHHEMIVAPNAI